MKPNTKLMDAEMIQRSLMRMSHEILERNKGTQDLAIIGIRSRGAFLAQRIAGCITAIDGAELPVGILDITLYWDDLTMFDYCPVVHSTEVAFDISDKKLILVDDVLFTGRTIRCALDELIDLGRPQNIQLAVLIDRGYRELPIRADYVGKNVPTARTQSVDVHLSEVDECDEVVLLSRGGT